MPPASAPCSAPFGGDPLLALIANKLSSKRLLGAGTHSGPLPPLAEGGSGQLPTLAEGREGSAGNNSEAPGPPGKAGGREWGMGGCVCKPVEQGG